MTIVIFSPGHSHVKPVVFKIVLLSSFDNLCVQKKSYLNNPLVIASEEIVAPSQLQCRKNFSVVKVVRWFARAPGNTYLPSSVNMNIT